MASSLMHLAVTQNLARRLNIQNAQFLCFGAILPDGGISGNAHLKETFDGKKTLDLESFRKRYASQMTKDSVYMGYYMHMVQDIYFRHFIYTQYAWDPKPEGNVEKLHNDYALLNPYLVEKYNLSFSMLRECSFNVDFAQFDTKSLLQAVKAQFECVPQGKTFFFTKKMADEYIKKVTDFCDSEVKDPHLDSKQYAWSQHI